MVKFDLADPPRDILDRDVWEALEVFLNALLASGASEKTVKAYRAAISDFLEYSGIKCLREVSEELVDKWKADRIRRGFPRKRNSRRSGRRTRITLHYYTLFLRGFLKWAGLPVKVSVVRAPRSREVDALSEEELSRLEEAARDLLDIIIIRLLCETGLRAGEALSIRVRDIDLSLGEIVVREGKYGEKRTVFFTPVLGELLSVWISLRKLKPGDRLIPLTYVGLWKRLKKLAERAGLDSSRIRPHVLRHTFATNALRRGLNVMALQRILGHSDVKVTQIYTHLHREDLRKAYLAAFLDGSRSGMKTCRSCGRTVPPDASFCPYCGIRL